MLLELERPRTADSADTSLMRRALHLAERGRRTAAPNPWVGCVLVSPEGEVIAEGFHRRAGEPHAEAHALDAAGPRARGSTAYVTLEPCAHVGRTPPCVDGLIAAGVSRVVVGVLDPDPRVAGRGMAILRDAGIQTELEQGPGAEVVAESLAPYLHHRRTGRAFCVLKSAVSLDGRTAAADGSSQWITQSAARSDAHALRAESQAILVGSGTATADLPSLTVRDADPLPDRQPLRVLLDSHGRVPATGPLFDTRLAPTLVLTSSHASMDRVAAWHAAGAEVAEVPSAEDGSLDLDAVLKLLGARGVLQVLVEGGATLAGSLVRQRLVNRLVLYAGCVSLGELGRPLFGGPGPLSMTDARRWRLLGVKVLGQDVRLDYASLSEAASHAL